jgi:hypothetical protein
MIKNWKLFNESITNISTKRNFIDNFYKVYDMSKKDLGNYLNTWFSGKVLYASETPYFKNKIKSNLIKDFIIVDEMWTVKNVDEYTSLRLYNRRVNPISLNITCKTGGFKEGDKHLYNLSCKINSIDDSSYTIHFIEDELDNLKSIRSNIMKWVSSKKVINGDEFINYGIELGADKDTISYD